MCPSFGSFEGRKCRVTIMRLLDNRPPTSGFLRGAQQKAPSDLRAGIGQATRYQRRGSPNGSSINALYHIAQTVPQGNLMTILIQSLTIEQCSKNSQLSINAFSTKK